MNLIRTLEKLYHKDFELIHTDWGLSNDLYLFIIDKKKYVVRLPKEDIQKHLDHRIEREVQLIARDVDIDFKEVYYDAKEHLRITEYVEGLIEFKDYSKSDRYQKVIRLIHTFHSLHIDNCPDFDLVQKYHSFKKEIKNPLFPYEKYEGVLKEFEKLEEPYILSHNDLVSGNLLFGEKDYLIDYEYVAMNHPYFDLMSFLCENQIDDETIREEIYQLYFQKEIDEKTRKTLSIIEDSQNLLWAAWANMLYDSRKEEVYRNIFLDKKKRLERKSS